ncbi:DeoR/GlpR family DNA-binding transcription regulator [Humibacter soli]
MAQVRGVREVGVRHQRLLDALRLTGFQTVSSLASQLDVSDMTVRRDLRKLQETGAVRVVHGGASLPPGPATASGYEVRAVEHAPAKRAIAEVAAGLVADEDTIGIDGGTTTFEVSAALPAGFLGSVVTGSVPVILQLAQRDRIHLVAVGGDLYRASQAFVGPAAVAAIEGLRFRTLFLGAGAADKQGLYVAADIERPSKLALMAAADRVVVLLDSSKFESFAPVRLCSWDEIDVVVCDRDPGPEVTRALEAADVELLLTP